MKILLDEAENLLLKNVEFSYIVIVLFQGGDYLTSLNLVLTCLFTGLQTSRSGVHETPAEQNSWHGPQVQFQCAHS